jgi:hypothetical protein
MARLVIALVILGTLSSCIMHGLDYEDPNRKVKVEDVAIGNDSKIPTHDHPNL